jgi:F0F1-type ATP synthase membrane subunit a
MVFNSLDQFKIAPLISLVVAGVDFSFINFLLAALLALFVLQSYVFFIKDAKTNPFFIIPSSWQNLIEKLYAFVTQLWSDIITTRNEKYLFYFTVVVVFIFILLNNVIGLVFYSFPVTSYITLTFFMLFSIFVGMTILGFQRHANSNKVTSLLGVATKTFFNNLGTISSVYSIIPPKSLGKISMFSWFASQFEEPIFIISFILAKFVMLIIAILGFLFIYTVYKKDNFFVNEVIPYSQKLSPIRKLIFGGFTVFTAIPNKFWINVQINFISVFIISTIAYLLCLVFPVLFFFYLIYLILCFESFLFGLLYEYSEYFRKGTNFLLFGNSDELFAADYFSWFWGNMWKQAAKKAAPIVTGAAVAVEAKRQQEIAEKTRYADDLTKEASIYTKEGFQTPNERAGYHKDRQDEWVQDNGTVTKMLKAVEDWLWKAP